MTSSSGRRRREAWRWLPWGGWHRQSPPCRVPRRQGSALAEGIAERMKACR